MILVDGANKLNPPRRGRPRSRRRAGDHQQSHPRFRGEL